MHKIIITFVLLVSINGLFAQKNINNYKYIIVPDQYDFLKTEDQYQLNSLTKFLFEKSGFIAFLNNEKPVEAVKNNCSALNVKVVNESSMFTTKLKIQLIDCYNTIVFETLTAKSKEKDFKRAYHAALRSAFEEIEELNYSYTPSTNKEPITETKKVVETKVEIVPEVKEVEPGIVKGEVELVNKKPAVVLKKKKEIKAPKQNAPKQKVTKQEKVVSKSIIGNYAFKQWGKSTITANGDNYVIKGGDENFQFATIYKTSTPNTYIIKYVTHKQPRLVKITSEGNLTIDSESEVEVVKKVN